jgi:LPXTG-motif cell wall-anchored protein
VYKEVQSVKRALARALAVTGCVAASSAGLVQSAAGVDAPAAALFSIFSVSDYDPTIGSTIEVHGVGCEQGTDLTSPEWEVQLEFYITDGTEFYWLSTGVVDELNVDGTWSGSITLTNEVDDKGLGVFDAVGSRVHAQCRRVNSPGGLEVLDAWIPDVQLSEGGASPTTTVAAPPETTTSAPPVPDNDGSDVGSNDGTGVGDELPVTGTSSVPLTLLGIGMLLLGGGALSARRRAATSR